MFSLTKKWLKPLSPKSPGLATYTEASKKAVADQDSALNFLEQVDHIQDLLRRQLYESVEIISLPNGDNDIYSTPREKLEALRMQKGQPKFYRNLFGAMIQALDFQPSTQHDTKDAQRIKGTPVVELVRKTKLDPTIIAPHFASSALINNRLSTLPKRITNAVKATKTAVEQLASLDLKKCPPSDAVQITFSLYVAFDAIARLDDERRRLRIATTQDATSILKRCAIGIQASGKAAQRYRAERGLLPLQLTADQRINLSKAHSGNFAMAANKEPFIPSFLLYGSKVGINAPLITEDSDTSPAVPSKG